MADAISLQRFVPVLIAYALAVAAGLLSLWWLASLESVPASRPLLFNAAVADLVATLVVFGFSLAYRNSSFYDPYWSVAPPLLLLYWCWQSAPVAAGSHWRLVLLAAVVLFWAVRLTLNWARGWDGLQDEDWRYRNLQRSLGPLYWPVSLLGIHLLPTVWVFVGCFGVYAASGAALVDDGVLVGGRRTHLAPLWWLDLLALLIGIGAIVLEMRADAQLRQFRRQRQSSAQLLRTGVWAWCRHPNYLGEIGFWLSVALFGAAALPGAWWVWLGPLLMLFLFVGITIPMIERKLEPAKPDYRQYRASTPMLLPRPWR